MNLVDFQSLRVYKPEDLPRWDWLDFDMVRMLDELTFRLGRSEPLQILSLFRTQPENEKVGGAPKSMHLLGKAVDFVPPGDPLEAYRLAEEVGFTGIGLYLNEKGVTSIHADNRPGYDARWGVLSGVYGTVDRVVSRLKSLAVTVVEQPELSLGTLVLTIIALWYIFRSR